MHGRLATLFIMITLPACAGDAGRSTVEQEQADREAGAVLALHAGAAGQPAVIDSVRPAEEDLARFRADIPRVHRLRSGRSSMDDLLRTFVGSVARGDTAAVEPLSLSLAEWAWLYFPQSPVAQPPYQLPPALAWFQYQQVNRTGVVRVFRELGGRTLEYHGHTCAEPVQEGNNVVWTRCEILLAVDGAAATPFRLFAAVVQRNGRYAFLSFHNDY